VSIRTAIVVGAGIAGLAAAGALARTGWQVTLLERADRLRPGRAAVLLWPNGIRALHALGLGAGLDAIATPVPPPGVCRPSGRFLQQPDPGTPAAVALHRADLHDTFVAGLGERVEICTGVAIRSTCPTTQRPGVGDGSATWRADLVVGADGADSLLRRRLAPTATLVSAGYALWRAVIPWYRAPDLRAHSTVGGETIGDGHRFSYAALGEHGETRGGVYWVAAAPGAARPEPPEVQLALLRRWFAGWHPPIGDLLAATDPDDLVQETARELRPLPRVAHPAGSGGGYVLVGDAAHAMSGQAGQGPGLALEDAATLLAALHKAAPGGALREALHDYARLRTARAGRMATHIRRLDAALLSRGRFSVGSRFAPRLLDRVVAAGAEWQPPTP
jgi:2-polyprenyl-6-methoxyphenol hydroxylase-like FAD-dependent oxidoreductase